MASSRFPLSSLSSAMLGALLCGVASGCGGGQKPVEQQQEPVAQPMVEGSVVTAVQQIQKSTDAQPCDSQFADHELEIAQDLDAHEKEIEDASATLGPSKYFRRVELGPTFVREPISVPDPRPGWIETRYGWDNIYRNYLKLKKTPVDVNWVRLNQQARSILADDQNRVLNGVNVYLHKDSAEMVSQLRRVVFQCMEDLTCILPRFSAGMLRAVRQNPYYANYWSKLAVQDPEPSVSRDFLVRFLKRLDADLRRYSFVSNDTVSRSGSNIVVPLDSGVFQGADVQAQLASYIESVWTSDILSVKVQWENFADNSDIFRILLGQTVGGRSYVQWKDRTVQLFPNVRTRSIAHEIGHVLGFKDRYYSVWHPESCSYVYQETEADIMSTVDTGSVTLAEWNLLLQAYGYGR